MLKPSPVDESSGTDRSRQVCLAMKTGIDRAAGVTLFAVGSRRSARTRQELAMVLRTDPWLERWLPLVVERAAGAAVLELGCGVGDDTATLVSNGLDVIALDHSEQALAIAKVRAGKARFAHQDLRADFPVGPASVGIVVASLSLHYFSWQETVALVQRVHDVLRPGGVLLCRLNSTEDRHFGASGHPVIEENYYRVRGEPKRFFDRATLDRLFAEGWAALGVELMTSRKYLLRKVLWEVVVEKATS